MKARIVMETGTTMTPNEKYLAQAIVLQRLWLHQFNDEMMKKNYAAAHVHWLSARRSLDTVLNTIGDTWGKTPPIHLVESDSEEMDS